jgi:glycosyltransferase A (GT-A) superfamily protein (DUF2064 family)
VKTRLTPPLEPAQAAALAEGMLRDAVERCLASPAFETVLLFAPPEEEAWFRAAFPDLADLRPQRGAGLAERLASGFEELLAEVPGRTVVAVGSDQPLVLPERIAEAHAALERGADVVLGPDLGGGYYLVGLSAAHPELFLGVEMGSAGMYAATVELARGLGLSVERLPTGYDVDVERDLVRLREDLERWRSRGGEGDPAFPRSTDRSLRELFPPRP